MPNRDTQISWSLINPQPTFYLHKPTDSHICYWRGIAMTRNQALMIIMHHWLACYTPNRLKQIEFQKFKRCVSMGTFGDVHWYLNDFNYAAHYNKLQQWIVKNSDANFFQTMSERHSIQEALCWLTDEDTIDA